MPFGVEQTHYHHPASKSGKEDGVGREGAIGVAKIDGNRMFLANGGNQAMGAKPRTYGSPGKQTANRTNPSSFKVRKRTLKG